MIDTSWVLALMLRAEPNAASSPWRDTYESTATAIARAAAKNPLRFAGEDDAERTAALLVGIAWYESGFRPDAEGDRPKLADGKRGRARSVCALQVHESNFASLGVTREELLTSIDRCVETGLRLVHTSFIVCRAKPLAKRLDHYARGGNGCLPPAKNEGEHRVRKALSLYAAVPPPNREFVGAR